MYRLCNSMADSVARQEPQEGDNLLDPSCVKAWVFLSQQLALQKSNLICRHCRSWDTVLSEAIKQVYLYIAKELGKSKQKAKINFDKDIKENDYIPL